MIKGVKFVSIPVRDQDRALEFYTEKLGMRVITDSPFDDTQRWIELGIPRADTKVVLFTASGQEHLIGGTMNITFVADDVVQTASVLKARGVEFRAGATEVGLGDGRSLQGSRWKCVRTVDTLTEPSMDGLPWPRRMAVERAWCGECGCGGVQPALLAVVERGRVSRNDTPAMAQLSGRILN